MRPISNGNIRASHFILIKLVNGNSLIQKWYADDGNAVGNLKSLRRVLDDIIKHGKYFGIMYRHRKASSF